MLLQALDTLQEPTAKVQALILHACAKTKCKGVRRRLLSRVVSRAPEREFQGWDMQALSMYIQSISSFGYTSKVTYRQAAQAALVLCQTTSVVRDMNFMKSLSLLLWALAKAERTMSAPASGLFSVAANELLASSRRVLQASDEVDTGASSSADQPQHVAFQQRSHTRSSHPQASLTASCNMHDCSLLLWALVTAAQARVKQAGGLRNNEWRGSGHSSNSATSSAHPSMTSSSKELLRRHWGDVPVVEAVQETLAAIAHEGPQMQVRSALSYPGSHEHGAVYRCRSSTIVVAGRDLAMFGAYPILTPSNIS